jgi:hypothetical protein
MKKSLLISFLLLSFFAGFSQGGYFFHAVKSSEKYFVAVDYGMGAAHWKSVFKSTEFYDKDGAVINSGDLKFTANSPARIYDVNVMAPVKRVRIGLGIAFEFNYLAQLKVYTKEGEDFLLFDEGLRFDKIYLQTEVPFKYDTDKKYTFNWNIKLGWFGYTNVKRFNFLGDRPFPISFLIASGVTADYEIYPQIYAFVLPNLEYKFYDNYNTDTPVQIRHNVFSASILCGIRVDLGRFYN